MTDPRTLATEALRAVEGERSSSVIYEQLRQVDLDAFKERQGHLHEVRLHPKWMYRLTAEPAVLEATRYGIGAFDPAGPLRLVGAELIVDQSVDYIVVTVRCPVWESGARVFRPVEFALSMPDVLVNPPLIAYARNNLEPLAQALLAALDERDEAIRLLRAAPEPYRPKGATLAPATSWTHARSVFLATISGSAEYMQDVCLEALRDAQALARKATDD